MNNRYSTQSTTPLERINQTVTGSRAFRITLGIKLAAFLVGLLDRIADLLIGLLDTTATLLLGLATLGGFAFALYLAVAPRTDWPAWLLAIL